MRIRDLFSKIRDLFSKIRDYETKKTAGAAEPPEPPSLAPMPILYRQMSRRHANHDIGARDMWKKTLAFSNTAKVYYLVY